MSERELTDEQLANIARQIVREEIARAIRSHCKFYHPGDQNAEEPQGVQVEPGVRSIIQDALDMFKLTQRLADYPASHWSNRAQHLLDGLPVLGVR